MQLLSTPRAAFAIGLTLALVSGISFAAAKTPHEIQTRYPGSRITALVDAKQSVLDADFYLVRGKAHPTLIARVPKAPNQPVSYAVSNELIVTLKPGRTRAELFALIGAQHKDLKVLRQLGKPEVLLVRSTSRVNPWLLAKSLAAASAESGIFASVEVNQVIPLDVNQYGIGLRFDQWALHHNAAQGNFADDDTDTDGAEMLSRLRYWRGPAPTNVVVAVIDSGIARNHPALKNRQWLNPREIAGNGIDDDGNGKVDDVLGWNFIENSKNIDDRNGHGSHVAGIIAAEQPNPGFMIGLAPNARILTLKVAEQKSVVLSAAIEAIYYAVNQGATVINLSWASQEFSPALNAAIDYTNEKDVFTVAAAGNALKDKPPVDISTNPVYPCLMRVSVCVAASDQSGKVAAYSNYSTGPGIVLLAAPGSDILSTVSTTQSGYGVMSGTSMATPHVAATASLIRGIYSDSDISAIRIRLLHHADPILDAPLLAVRQRLNTYRAVTAPTNLVSSEGSAYCTELVGQEPRYRMAPFANSYEAGIDGSSEARAYTICSARQLLAIHSQIDAGRKYFKVAQDLDWNDLHEAERHSIGGHEQPFQGLLMGQGFTLRNFSLTTRLNYTGLFARIGPGGAIINFRLRDVNVKGMNNVGGLAGLNEGVLNDVHVEGVVSGRDNVGGVTGLTQHAFSYPDYTGKVANAFFEGRVAGSSNVGGISGGLRGPGTIEQVFAKGAATATDAAKGVVGGVAGIVEHLAMVRESHAMVLVTGATAGGAVGMLRCAAKIENTYTQATAEGANAGGLVGFLENAAVLTSYSLSYASGGPHVGGLVGKKEDDLTGDTPGKFACTGSSERASPSSIILSYYLDQQNWPGAGGQAKSAYELQQASTFQGWQFSPRSWVMPKGESPSLNMLPRTRMSFY